jgi:osmotically-inducible protein OsmY
MMRNRKSVLSLAITTALAFAPLAAGGQTASDEEIKLAIEHKFEKKKIHNGGGPAVEVVNGNVILSGKVKSVWFRNEAVKLALETDGVNGVADKLEIAFGESDQKVGEEVAKKIRSYPFFTVYDDANIALNEGHVTLTGYVTMPFKTQEIAKRVSKVMGVQSVTTEIETLPTNIGDGRLRARLTRRIYGDPMFREYAYRLNPPIHIIVVRGKVALTGAVRSRVEKLKAEHIARGTFGVFNVENRLSVGD